MNVGGVMFKTSKPYRNAVAVVPHRDSVVFYVDAPRQYGTAGTGMGESESVWREHMWFAECKGGRFQLEITFGS